MPRKWFNNLWDLKSRWYHPVRRMPGIRWILEQEKRNCRDLISKSGFGMSFILDIGTGAGSSLDLFPKGIPIVAVDRSTAMLQQAFRHQSGLLPVVADARHLPFKSGCVEFCSCIGVTEYLPSFDLFLKETFRVLSSSGRFLCTGAGLSFFNRLRMFLGHRLNLLPGRTWPQYFKNFGFLLLDCRTSWLQHQWILKKLSS